MNNRCKCIYCGFVFVPIIFVGEILPSICEKCRLNELPKHVVEENYLNKISPLPSNIIFLSGSIASGFSF